MSETKLRRRARIGSLKPWALIIGLLAVFGIWTFALKLQTALNNPTEPQSVQIGQLVREEIDADRYVTVAGTALYTLNFEETQNEKHVATLYALIDQSTGDLFFVRTTQPLPDLEQEAVTLTGMTRASPAELKTAIEGDLPAIQEAGLAATPNHYLAIGEKPGNAAGLTLALAGLGLVLALCVATMFFSSSVFFPRPAEAGAAPAPGEVVTKATGRFQKLKRLEPSIEVGRGTHRFRETIANLVPLEGQRLMVYIHLIQSQGVYGITLFRQKSHWAAFVDLARTQSVEPGSLLGWRDRSALQIQYKDDQGKPRALILTFDDAGAQATVLSALRQMGFSVGTGSPAPF